MTREMRRLTEGLLEGRGEGVYAEFDRRRRRAYVPLMSATSRRSVQVPLEVIEAAKARGMGLGDYITELHLTHRSGRVAMVASVLRSFALLEMARVPVEPAYLDLVKGAFGAEVEARFRIMAKSGLPHALPRAAAGLLGADTRAQAIEAVMIAAQSARVLHEGFIEAARLLEGTYMR